jgi:hypothetical protein
LDFFKPEYNICKTAGSSLGRKHSLETLEKLKGRIHSPETILKIKIAMKGVIRGPRVKKGHLTQIVNVTNNTVNTYISVRYAAKAIKLSHSTLLKYKKLNKLINNKYLVSNT